MSLWIVFAKPSRRIPYAPTGFVATTYREAKQQKQIVLSTFSFAKIKKYEPATK